MPNPTLTDAIDALAAAPTDLDRDEQAAVLAEIMGGNASEVETAAVLIALRTKGETVDELAGLAATMRALRRAGRDRRAPTWSTPPAPAAAARPSTSPPPRR